MIKGRKEFKKPAQKVSAAAAAPSPPPPVPVVATKVSRSGRLSKDFWEDMLIAAMMAMFFHATLEPKSAVEVQRWMEGWLSKNIKEAEHPGETALKERAAKVFTAWRESRK